MRAASRASFGDAMANPKMRVLLRPRSETINEEMSARRTALAGQLGEIEAAKACREQRVSRTTSGGGGGGSAAATGSVERVGIIDRMLAADLAASASLSAVGAMAASARTGVRGEADAAAVRVQAAARWRKAKNGIKVRALCFFHACPICGVALTVACSRTPPWQALNRLKRLAGMTGGLLGAAAGDDSGGRPKALADTVAERRAADATMREKLDKPNGLLARRDALAARTAAAVAAAHTHSPAKSARFRTLEAREVAHVDAATARMLQRVNDSLPTLMTTLPPDDDTAATAAMSGGGDDAAASAPRPKPRRPRPLAPEEKCELEMFQVTRADGGYLSI